MPDQDARKEQLGVRLVELLQQPEVASAVADALDRNCDASNHIAQAYIDHRVKEITGLRWFTPRPFQPSREDITTILSALDQKMEALPEKTQQQFAQLNDELARAGLTREALVVASADEILKISPEVVRQAGKQCWDKGH